MAAISREVPPEKACDSGKEYYNDTEASRYTECAQTQQIQRDLTKECLLLLGDFVDLSKRQFLLNIGSGSGLCGSLLSQQNLEWIGTDISRAMLENANPNDEHVEMDCLGVGLPFRNEMFDGAISVSAIQWVCVSASPEMKSFVFMKEMFRVLKWDTVFIAQCYPNTKEHARILQHAAVQAGFYGNLYTSLPHQSKAKKKFMCLYKTPKGKEPIRLKGNGSCCLSWPDEIPCIMSWMLLARDAGKFSEINPIETRIANEHFENSCRMIRLLRRAAGACCDKPTETSNIMTVEIFSCSSVDLCPCGGNFSCHVCTDDGIDEAKCVVVALFNSLSNRVKHRIHHGHSTSVPAGILDSWKRLDELQSNPYFQLDVVAEGSMYTVAILNAPKLPPLTAIMFEFQRGDDHGRLYELIRRQVCCIVGVDVRCLDSICSVAVLLYAPNLTPSIDTITL